MLCADGSVGHEASQLPGGARYMLTCEGMVEPACRTHFEADQFIYPYALTLEITAKTIAGG